MKLDDLYFDVIFNDKTSETIKKIKAKLNKEKFEVKLQPKVSIKDIQAAIDKATSGKRLLHFKFGSASISRTGLKAIQTSLDSRIWYLNNVDIKTTKFEERLAKAVERAMRKGANDASVGITAGGGGTTSGSTSDANRVSTTLYRYIRIIQGMLTSSIFTNFLRKLADTYGKFEQQLVALKSMMQSGIKGNTLFNQIKDFSVKSPFQFSDLVGFTKQLTAFQVPYNEIFDTTKRLADLSAGLGVDMSRIILAYGQVRSASYLRGQELRQFTEAGVPILQMLADKFSLLEKRVVSVGDVFDYVSKRKVPFEMVKEVIQDMTNEGGIFYKMQERQAETLRGRITNLADAYDILLYNIGKSGAAGYMSSFVSFLQKLLECKNLIMAIGAAASVVFLKIMVAAAVNAKRAIVDMMAKAGMSLVGWKTAIFSAIVGLGVWVSNLRQDVENAKKAVEDFTKESSKSIKDFVESIKDIKISIDANGGDKVKTLADTLEKLKELIPENQATPFIAHVLGGKDIDEQLKRLEEVRSSLEDIEIVMRRLGEKKVTPYMYGVFKRDSEYVTALDKYLNSEQPKLIQALGVEGMGDALGSRINKFIKEATGGLTLSAQEKNEIINKLVEAWASDNSVFSGKGGVITKINLQLRANVDEEDIMTKSTALAQYYFDAVADAAKENGNDLQSLMYDAMYGTAEAQKKAKDSLSKIYTDAGDKAKETLGLFEDEFNQMVQRMQANPIDIQFRARLGLVDDNVSGYNKIYLQRLYDKMFGEGSFYTSKLDPASQMGKLKQSEKVKYISDIIKNNSDATNAKKALQDAYKDVVDNIKNATEANDMEMVENYKKQKEYLEEASQLIGWRLEETKETKTKTDEILKSEKDRYSTLKKYIQEYEKLVKLYGEAGALEKLKSQSQYKEFGDDFIKALGGASPANKGDFLRKYADYLEKTMGASGERGKTIRDIRIDAENADLEQQYKDTSDAIEQMTKEIATNAKKWDTFNKILSITGDEEFAQSIAFGGRIGFSNQGEQLLKQLNDAGISDVQSLKGKGSNELTKQYGKEIATLIEKYFEIINKEQEDALNDIVKVLEDAITQDVKIGAINRKYDNLKTQAQNLPEGKRQEAITGIENARNSEISKVKWDFFKKTPEYAKVFENLDRLSYESLSGLLEVLTNLNPQIQDDVASFKELQDKITKIREELLTRNPFDAISSSARNIGALSGMKFDRSGNATVATKRQSEILGKKIGEKVSRKEVNDASRGEMKNFENGLDGLSKAFSDLRKTIDPVIDLFDTLGMTGASDILGGISDTLGAASGVQQGLDTASQVAGGMGMSGVSSALSAAGPWGAAAGAALSIASSIFALHDKALQKQIDALKREEKSAKALYDLVEKRLEYTLGKGYGADTAKGLKQGTTYLQQRNNLYQQLFNKQKQLELENDKKKKDKDAIADLESEIAEMKETIKQYSMELADELFSINISDWASQIGDSLVNAFSEGKSAADAFDDAVADILKNMVKNMAQLYILEPALNQLKSYLFGIDGLHGVFGSDLSLSQEDLQGMIPILANLKTSIGNVKDLYDAINEVAKQSGIDLSGVSSGLSGSIQSVTEDTADLLASYINAIRARLMAQGAVIDVSLPALQNLAEAQLRELQSIVENTSRNAAAAERIDDAISALTLVGSNGKQLKVKAY